MGCKLSTYQHLEAYLTAKGFTKTKDNFSGFYKYFSIASQDDFYIYVLCNYCNKQHTKLNSCNIMLYRTDTNYKYEKYQYMLTQKEIRHLNFPNMWVKNIFEATNIAKYSIKENIICNLIQNGFTERDNRLVKKIIFDDTPIDLVVPNLMFRDVDDMKVHIMMDNKILLTSAAYSAYSILSSIINNQMTTVFKKVIKDAISSTIANPKAITYGNILENDGFTHKHEYFYKYLTTSSNSDIFLRLKCLFNTPYETCIQNNTDGSLLSEYKDHTLIAEPKMTISLYSVKDIFPSSDKPQTFEIGVLDIDDLKKYVDEYTETYLEYIEDVKMPYHCTIENH